MRHYNTCPALFDHFNPFWLGVAERIGCTDIFTDLLFRIAVRSERLCILVAGLLDTFVTAFNLQRTHHGIRLNVREPMYGKVKMTIALCPAWAYQSKCLATIQTSSDLELPSADALKEICYAAYLSRAHQEDRNQVHWLAAVH